MGPSGSGKTTLLNVLARRGELCDTEGRIMVNGSTLSLQAFRKLSSYVEQEDALIGALTVWETINFAARLSSRYTSSRAFWGFPKLIVSKLIPK
jgi:ABC-type multidrug transport system ATPase subunit